VERKLPVELIPVEAISEERRYGARFDYADLPLEASLKTKGILFPLLLARGAKRSVEIISGHKRFLYAQRIGERRIPARFVEQRFSEKELFLLSLYSNWNQNVSELDRMEALRKAETVFGFTSEEIRQDLGPALGIPETGGWVEEYRKVGRLRGDIHLLIHQKQLPFRGASALSRFSDKEQELLVRAVFDRMHLTTNQLLLIAEWLGDLKKIDKTSLEVLFQEDSLQGCFDISKGDGRGRGEKFFEGVRALRFPRLSKKEKEFKRFKETLKTPQEILLEPPSGFEAEGVLLRAHLRNRESLERVLRYLESHGRTLESLF
jgi:hypothetical protein